MIARFNPAPPGSPPLCASDPAVFDGKVDVLKLNALMFDNYRSGYYTVGGKAGQAFEVGKKLI